MPKSMLARRLPLLIAILVVISVCPPALAEPAAAPSLLELMQQELNRANSDLSKVNPPPYFISYSVLDHQLLDVVGSDGALWSSTLLHRRGADVSVRVGSKQLDNTHGDSRYSGITSGVLPLSDDPDAIARILWSLTDREYQQASQALLKVTAEQQVRTADEDNSADFSSDPAETRIDSAGGPWNVDRARWESEVREISAEFKKYPQIPFSMVALEADQMTHYFVSSQGSKTVRPERLMRLVIQAEAQAPDGMRLVRVENFLAPTPDKMPALATVASRIAQMAQDLGKLQQAPLAEPYSGPALLSGRAAAVFFHEVLGHRLEGQRQRGDEEGQTFAKKLGEAVLPKFLTVVDDPTLRQLGGEDLAGWYDTDEEGEPAQRVTLIQDGILKDFLMSRMPVHGFSHSNGHGRAQPGYMPVGRQGNLIVESTHSVSPPELRHEFIEEIKRQGKPYGLYFEDIEGGFTLTTRNLPQSFKVLPVMVWRVYADGQPDDLVRGVDIVGTPLAALGHILATGQQQYVFNGICGAESGNIPVSAAAPAMLFSEIEVQRREQSHERPPILPPPALGSEARP